MECKSGCSFDGGLQRTLAVGQTSAVTEAAMGAWPEVKPLEAGSEFSGKKGSPLFLRMGDKSQRVMVNS